MDKKLPLLRLGIVPSFLIVIVAHILTSIHAKTGTITPLNPYTNDFIKEDVEELHHALHKKKLDADVIKDILTSRSLKQRLIIDQNYNKTYNERIVEYIQKRTEGVYQGVLKGMFKTISEFYAHDLGNGMKHKDDYTLIQVLTVASKSAEMIKNVTKDFKNEHGEDLYEAIGKSEFKDSNFKMAMQKILTGERKPDVSIIDMNEVISLVQKLYFGLQKINEDSVVLDNVLTILISTPVNTLNSVTLEYKKTYQKELHEDLDDKLKGSLGELTRQLARFVNDEDTYFAELLRSAMKGPGTKESVITRLIVCLSEYNLVDVKKAYENLYGSSLRERLDDDLSGNYQNMIMAILGEDGFGTDTSDSSFMTRRHRRRHK